MPFRLTPAHYGEDLRNIPDLPDLLWGEGDRSLLVEGVRVAIVGSRRCTSYGKRMAFQLAEGLVKAGVIVVSGLAYGIDTEAHQGALAGGGKTIAVLGCGLDLPYPASNRELRKRIEKSGAVVTEFPEGTGPAEWTFPRRNRIISGLSKGVVVVEAAVDSGSLITARWAADQGREVFAVPGPADSTVSAGTNRLIQQGAKLVTGVEDILEEVLPHYVRGAHEAPSEEEARLLDLLPSPIDQIIETSGFPSEKVAALMVNLEIAGKVKSLPGGIYAKISRSR